VKLGVNLGYAPPGTNPAELVPLVRTAEALGYVRAIRPVEFHAVHLSTEGFSFELAERWHEYTRGQSDLEPMPAADIPLSEHLRKIPPATRPTVETVIRTIKDVAPRAKEITYRSQAPRSKSSMWKIVRYAVDGANVVGVGTFPNHATLFFYRGREIDDGSGLLQGSGKDTRFVNLRTPADAEAAFLKSITRKAFKLAGGV